MKKMLFFLAVAGLISFAACGPQKEKADAAADTTQVMAADTAAAAVDTAVVK